MGERKVLEREKGKESEEEEKGTNGLFSIPFGTVCFPQFQERERGRRKKGKRERRKREREKRERKMEKAAWLFVFVRPYRMF